MANTEYHVSLHDLTHVFDDGRRSLTALSSVTIDVPPGQFTSVIGPSGCGKSTLLRLAGGLLTPSEGTALVDGEPPRKAQRAREIGFVFQDPSLLPWRTVAKNIALPLEVDHLERTRELPDLAELLDLVGLSEFRDYHPYELSGGMQQRVALARALAFNPTLLLMDEPFGAVDEITRSALRYELLRIWERHGGPAGRKTVLFVTHSVSEAITLSDRVIVLSGRPGRVRADIAIELPRPRTEEMEQTEPFLDYAAQLRRLLKEDAQ
ncbi:MAG: ABC transporter ATP-binding protein [Chloroflexi bacterium]|nr:ABC transporter ATP-binding protein [Chloroflexota bacterium]